MSLLSGLTCKACSLDVLSHELDRKSPDALNNNLRPKSDFYHGTLAAQNYNRRFQIPGICSEEEEEELQEETEEDNITISNESRSFFTIFMNIFVHTYDIEI